ncbi:CBS:MgtE intracellular region [Candidatus Methylomirabilis oxygeniifera]|uniref:CBS:MgtE intracellular region n=1 Tax=Methylomirabilis oxygeniifera TaxID=671143 RepID=D5MFK3_METO1|nr:CBS:MgtE intracellular region [Candidatus Methylomirabilis oxyfera]
MDAGGRLVGRLKDLILLPLGILPPVTKLVVLTSEKEELILPWEAVARLEHEPAVMYLSSKREALESVEPRAEEMGLGKTLVDRKVVDTKRHKVIRVNDLEFQETQGRLQLVAVEGGLRSLLRHLVSDARIEQLERLFDVRLERETVAWEVVEPVETELTKAKHRAAYAKLAKLHPADIADIIEELSPSERATVLASLDEETAAETLTETEPEVQTSMVQMMESEQAADILERMEPDEAADILSDLPEAKAQELLETMEKEEAQEVVELLTHEEDTAGGLMTTEVFTLPADLTMVDAIGRLRSTESAEAETIYYIYVTDDLDRLLGVLSLRELILADPSQRLSEIMERQIISVRPETGLREVTETFTKYNLMAVPVVDEGGELRGIITVDDVLNLLLPMIWKQRAAKKYI